MQKFVFIQTHVGGDNGLSEINKLLEDGWKVVETISNQPSSEGLNIELTVLIEKSDSSNFK